MNFKTGDKVKVVSLNNSFPCLIDKEFLTFLNKTFTVRHIFTIHDILHDIKRHYVTVEENTYHWNEKDLILANNSLEIE